MIKIFLLSVATCTLCYGQKEKCGVVIDKQTKLPISYASIYYSDNSSGTFATEKGSFCLPETAKKIDSVSISALGYQKLSLSYSNFLKTENFDLEISPINLVNVIVKGNKGKISSKEIGYAKRHLFSNGLNLNSNTRMACYVPNNDEKELILTNIYCMMKPKENNLVSAFNIRLRLYENKENLPSGDILQENLIAKVPIDAKKIDFNIKKYGIKVPKNGFWIGVESVGYTDKNDVYVAIKDRQIGKYKANNNTKTINLIERISPMYDCMNSDKPWAYVTRWNNEWKPFSMMNAKPQTFLFGARVEYYK